MGRREPAGEPDLRSAVSGEGIPWSLPWRTTQLKATQYKVSPILAIERNFMQCIANWLSFRARARHVFLIKGSATFEPFPADRPRARLLGEVQRGDRAV